MKESLVLYTAYYDKFRKLSDEQFGQLIRYMLSYQKTGVVPEIDDFAMSIVFDVVKEEMDRNNKKYEEICEKRRESGKLGGRPKKPNGFEENQKNQMVFEKAKKADNDNDNENDNENDNDKRESIETLSPSGEKSEVVPFKKTRKKFTPPTVEEVAQYCKERKNNVDAETFVAFYASKGWKVGKESMKDWKAAVITWEKRERSEPKKTFSVTTEDAVNRASLDKLQALEDFYLNGGST